MLLKIPSRITRLLGRDANGSAESELAGSVTPHAKEMRDGQLEPGQTYTSENDGDLGFDLYPQFRAPAMVYRRDFETVDLEVDWRVGEVQRHWKWIAERVDKDRRYTDVPAIDR